MSNQVLSNTRRLPVGSGLRPVSVYPAAARQAMGSRPVEKAQTERDGGMAAAAYLALSALLTLAAVGAGLWMAIA